MIIKITFASTDETEKSVNVDVKSLDKNEAKKVILKEVKSLVDNKIMKRFGIKNFSIQIDNVLIMTNVNEVTSAKDAFDQFFEIVEKIC